jgi:spore coat protein U-like protein
MEFSRALKPSFAATTLACLVLATNPTSAAPTTVTTTFAVTANVVATCVVSATPMAFVNYTSITPADSTSTITVSCSDLTTYNVGLNAGTSTGATVTSRKMKGTGTAVLAYHLYSDAARSVNWGDTVGTDTVTGTGTGAPQLLTVYGQVPAGQGPASGVYTDTITATVTF